MPSWSVVLRDRKCVGFQYFCEQLQIFIILRKCNYWLIYSGRLVTLGDQPKYRQTRILLLCGS
jgi:hypothetical protein